MDWELEEADADQPAGWSAPPPWRGRNGQTKCGACGRFLDRFGRCSLVVMTYRYGSPYGYEHR
jgi:hypothetical protein